MECKAHDFIRLKIDNKFEICQLCGTRREYKEPLSKIKVIGNDESVEIVTDKILIISKTRWGSDDPVKKVVDHSDTYIDSPPLRYRGDTVYTSDYVDGLKKEIEELKKDLEFNNFKKTSLDSQLYTENIHLKERCQSQSNDITELTKSWENSKKSLNYNLKKVEVLEDENNLLKTQLAELHQANVNLHNENEKLKKELKDKTKYVYEKTETRKAGQVSKSDVEIRTYDEHLQEQQLKINELEELNRKLFNKNQDLERSNKLLNNKLDSHKANFKGNRELFEESLNKVKELKEQLEIKETINQDLAKKYQLLEEEIQAYDINMLELVESYKKLEQDYNDSTERLKIKNEVLSNLTAHTNELEYKYKELQSDYNELSKNMLQGLQVKLQHRVKPYLSAGVVNVIIETKEDFK